MSTLFNQPVRYRYDLEDLHTLEECRKLLSDLLGKTPSAEAVIMLYRAEIERAKLSAYITNGDAFDEQMSGFGTLLAEANSILRDIEKEILE